MNGSDEVFEERLGRLSGAERLNALLQECERLSRQYLGLGPGNDAGRPLLHRAVDRLREAREVAGVDRATRIQIDNKLGSMLATMYLGGDAAAHDRDEAIELLDATIDEARLTEIARQTELYLLARLSIRRIFEMGPGEPVKTVEWCAELLHTVPREAALADVDRAERCTVALTEAAPMNASTQQLAAELRTNVNLLRDVFAGIDERDVESTSRLFRDLIARTLGTDAPEAGPQSSEAAPSPAHVPPAPDDESRQALRDLLATFTKSEGAPEHQPAQLAAALLHPDAATVDEAAAQEAVALATVVVEQGCADPVQHAIDRFLLGVALWVRSRTGDGDGWGDGDAASHRTDLRLGAEEIVAAACGLPVGHPLEVPALVSLPAFLDGFRPLRGVLDTVAEPFVERAQEARPKPGPETALLRALTGICRAAVAVRCGRPVDLPALRETVAAVPCDHPWRHRLTGAATTVDRSVAGLGRTSRKTTDHVVFLANPAGDREAASVEAMVLRRMFYPDSVGLGNTVERVDGPGTAAEVLARLPGPAGPGASLLHLGCAVRTTYPPALGLADGWLDLRHVAEQATGRSADTEGGLVILPADAAADPAADALLEAGFAAVVGWLWPVDAEVAALVMYRLHAFLADDGLAAVDAVRAVRAWMRNPDRDPLPGNPYPHKEAAHRTDLVAERYWAALHLRGR